MRRRPPGRPGPHVLVVRLDSAGDVLLSGPAVRAVAAGASRVTLVCGPRGHDAARLLPGVDEVVVHLAEWIDPEPPPFDGERALRLVERVRTLAVDEALILTSFHQSALPTALLLRMAGVRRIAAYSEDYPGSLLDVRHRVADDMHEVERALSLVATLGYRLPPGDPGSLRVQIPPQQPVPALPTSYVVVHPGASVSARAWAPEKFEQLVNLLAARGDNVVVTGSPGERELTARVAGAPRAEVVDLGGRTSFASLAVVLARAQAVVVSNTGPAHLAAAVGTPVVSVFAPTVPASRWRPWGVPLVLLGEQEIACAGCRARECPISGHPCVDALPVEAVADAVGALASARQPTATGVG